MIRLLALILTIATGFSGLVYEVTWQRYLATLLGSHSEATAAVLGIFLGGLSVGYWLFGVVTRRHLERARERGRAPRLFVLYGAVEAGIGAYALAFPTLFIAAREISTLVPLGSGFGFVFDLLLSTLLIGPPTVLMGGTIPVLTQALSRSLEDATRLHAFVYGFNTAGSFAGALAAGFWLIPTLGLVGVLQAMAVLNLAAGSAFLLLGWRAPAGGTPVPEVDSAVDRRVDGFATYAAAACLCGFAMMAIQTTVIRLAGLSFGSSEFTFSMVVAVFVLCIALGSFAVSALGQIPKNLLVIDLWALCALFAVLYTRLDDAPFFAHVVRSFFRDNAESIYPFYASAFVFVLLSIGLPIVLSGAILPLIFHRLRRTVGDLGDAAGRLYSWNTAGSLLGSLLGGYALLFWLDLHHVFRIAIGALAAAAVLVTLPVTSVRKLAICAAILAPVLFAITQLPAWSNLKLQSGLFRDRGPMPFTFKGPDAFYERPQEFSLIFYDDDPTTTVSVIENAVPDGRIERGLATNGKGDGSTILTYPTMGLTALVPAILGRSAERSFVVGYGVGITVGELAALEDARSVTVTEIAPGLVEAAPLFDRWNMNASTNPKVEIIRGDAYRTLLHRPDTFDIIISQPSTPWMTGIEMLYSREFLLAARERLSLGGVYVQWFHTYEADSSVIDIAIRTFSSVFKHVAIWYTTGSDLLMIGLDDPSSALDLDRIEARAARPDIAAGLRRCGVSSFAELIAHEIVPFGPIEETPLLGPVHTLLHPRLSHLAARAFFVGKEGDLPFTGFPRSARVGARNALVRKLAARHGGDLPAEMFQDIVRETCAHRPRECLTLLAKQTHDARTAGSTRRYPPDVRPLFARAVAAFRPDLGSLDDAVALYAGDDGKQSASPLETALLTTRSFERLYHHAAPFPRSVLAQVWSRCENEPRSKKRCRAGRARAELDVGKIVFASVASE